MLRDATRRSPSPRSSPPPRLAALITRPGSRPMRPKDTSRWGEGMLHCPLPLACRRTRETGGAAHVWCPLRIAPGSPLEIGRGPRPVQSDGWGQPSSRRGSAVSVGQHTCAGGKAPARLPAILRGGYPVFGPRKARADAGGTNERAEASSSGPPASGRAPGPRPPRSGGMGKRDESPRSWGDQDPVDALHASIRHLARTLGSLPAESTHRVEFAPLGDSPTADRGGARGGGRTRAWTGAKRPPASAATDSMPRVKNVPSGDVWSGSATSPPVGDRGPHKGRRSPARTGYITRLRHFCTVVPQRNQVLRLRALATYVADTFRADFDPS